MYLNGSGEYEKAIEISKEALTYRNDHLDFYYFIAKAYSFLNEYKKAEYYYDEYFKLYKKLENGYLVDDISVGNMSFARKNEMMKDRFVVAFKNKDFKYIIENYNDCKQDDNEELLIYTLIKEGITRIYLTIIKKKKLKIKILIILFWYRKNNERKIKR